VRVFLTVDTEAYPLAGNWREEGLHSDLQRDIYGITSVGEFGLRYQLRVLAKHKLTAVFMVESLFASVPQVGIGPLREIVRSIVEGGHDVQLHAHPEWLPYIPNFPVSFGAGLINAYPLDAQCRILERAITNLNQALTEVCKQNTPRICTFRAGDFAADAVTLRAVEQTGLTFDTSYNVVFGRLGTQSLISQPTMIGNVCEMPVSFFYDWPGHFRPAQLGASSYSELVYALEEAYAAGWASFVIVSHTFELLKNRRSPKKQLALRKCVRSRFEDLCEYLDRNRDRFQTATFSELTNPAALSGTVPSRGPIVGSVVHTLGRLREQLWDRLN
jgi:hypothetical protein